MTPPDTNTKKQAKRHRPALIGMSVAVAIAVIVAIVAFILPGMPADEQAESVPAAPVAPEPPQSITGTDDAAGDAE